MQFKSLLWDLFCGTSVLGIWPRFIEPQLILTTRLSVPIPHLPSSLRGLKILQFSDLHLNRQMSDSYLQRLKHTIKAHQPDLLTFTGDFLCYSSMDDPERLKSFLCSLDVPYGAYAVLGNHDYAECVSINDEGEYDVILNTSSSLSRAFRRLWTTIHLKKQATERAKGVPLHDQLIHLLTETPFQLLHNESYPIKIKGSTLNLCGFGEYMLGKLRPEQAFKNYQANYPGILLLHNPDGVPFLKHYPGDIILCGHTHGGQVNLPWMWKKFTLLENIQFKKGLFKVDGKWLFVNRGIGSVLPFRWFSPPELLLLTLE